MQWKGRRTSSNVEDRRRSGAGGMFPGGMGRMTGGRGIKVGGIGGIILLLVALYFGVDPRMFVDTGSAPSASYEAEPIPAGDEHAQFVAVVLADTEDVWNKLFAEMGRDYEEPRLVLFSDQVRSACGFASAAVGPFYCPADSQVYLDLSFFHELKRRFGAPGDFAEAYVIAHEVGHHVQNLLGISDEVHRARQRMSEEEYNQLSVRLELQADFFAGLWAHHAQEMKQMLEEGDVEEALGAASAIGDDRLQMQSRGYVVPESFTHGTAEQRVRWFRRGFETGDFEQGDTFAAENL
jgi:predicted metalloprotease